MNQEWISVNERLPEVSMRPVLIYGSRIDGHKLPIRIAYWNHVWTSWVSNVVVRRNVTHWMPLPEPPKE